MGIQSRYQRYELMSCIPIGILVRTIRERYLSIEIENLKRYYMDKYYTDEIPIQ